MTAATLHYAQRQYDIVWEKLPPDYPLPDEPVENLDHPFWALALREALELAGLIPPTGLIASNFGLCVKVDTKTVVKAPDWVYVPSVLPTVEMRRSYTPHTEGEAPLVVMEFLSDADHEEYSIRPSYPYGKLFFYEKLLQVPTYVIFDPATRLLEVRKLKAGQYELQTPNEAGHFWLEDLGLFLGIWEGAKAERSGLWLRWWDEAGNLLLWGLERIALVQYQVEQERLRAEQERQRADSFQNEVLQERLRAEQEQQRADNFQNEVLQERLRAEAERLRAERLAQRLRALGLEES
ncbi:Uma2 family endonuclease [Anthocerotibacter panamensis]|uniref:Uma2 family endonuclease n=1 Tax=Anthocerotibacter panamensis TaxID=2857077 RepID=UPI001C407194|nr:Uma2 family endonuclease [Anthocerotibacter panamensis]